jgi:alpha-beta hydrolase superfamily lysophospholipase
MLKAFGPELRREEIPEIPQGLAPFEEVAIPRPHAPGNLSGLWFPAAGQARGGVLLVHPWLPAGKAYFYRRHRIEELRKAGYDTLIFDLPGFGGSARPKGFFDREISAALAFLRGRCPGLPLHVWGVSSGGYWAHPAIVADGGVAGAFFEDVAPHLLEWSWRAIPKKRPFYLIFQIFLPTAYRYIDIRRHARARRAAAVAYVSGDRDAGVRPEDTRELAEAAGGEAIIIPGAEHLGSIKRANRQVLAAALALFRRAEAVAEASFPTASEDDLDPVESLAR